MSKKRRYYFIVICLPALLLVGRASTAATSFNGDRELLKLIAEADMANRDRIDTWSGDITIVAEIKKAGVGQTYLKQSTGHFLFDRTRDGVTCRLDECVSTDKDARMSTAFLEKYHRVRYTLGELCVRTEMVTKKGCYDYQPSKNQLMIRIRNLKPGRDWLNLPPLRYTAASQIGRRQSIHDRLMMRYHRWRVGMRRSSRRANPRNTSIDVDRNQDIVTYVYDDSYEDKGSRGLNETYKFDLGKDAKLIYHCLYTKDREKESRCTHEWTYAKVSGIWIPETHTCIVRNSGENGASEELEYVAFKNQKVNEPIDPNVFTVTSLGMPSGTEIVDSTEARIYRYDGGQEKK
jgi:hypothetical protein